MSKNGLITPVLIGVATLLVGLGAGYWYGNGKQSGSVVDNAGQDTGGKVLYYRHPMKPGVTSPIPAKDDMGMDYVPVYSEESGDGNKVAGLVEIDPVTVQNIGVRTALAREQVLGRTIRGVGRVAYDEDRLSRLHPKVEGWIEKLYVKRTGERLKKGDMLLSIYSPTLVATQQEYLLALRNLKTLEKSPFKDIRQGAENLVASSKKRLQFLDMPPHQLRELTKGQVVMKALHIQSPFAGIVMKLGAREGEFVAPQTELFMLADLSRVWVYVDVYEYELPWVATGDAAEMTVVAVPGEVFKGKVSYIYPYMEKKTRTVRVRLEFDNAARKLKPDMFATVVLRTGRKVPSVVVPTEALVRSGPRVQVFIQRERGKFEPREVTPGVSADGLTQIIAGVTAGERVVTSSQFLIDSESKLREATAKMMSALSSDGGAEAPSAEADELNMDDMTMESLEAGSSPRERPSNDTQRTPPNASTPALATE